MKDRPEWDYEESYHSDIDRKEAKKEKKIASKTDRSKYKKTDREKLLIKEAPKKENELIGRVLSIVSQDITVDTEGVLYTCTLRGTLKKEKQRLKNLITVGDIVYFEQGAPNTGTIHFIAPRKSLLSRADHLLKRNEQLLAANIDQVLITVSAAFPDLKPALIDRYIIASEKGSMTPILLINKIDLLDEERFEKDIPLYEETKKTYQDLGYKVISLSCKTNEGLAELKELMKDKISVFSGQSGTGKSSLINKVTGLDLSVGELTKKTLKGGHTTTQAKLVKLPFGGFCIDTPGIRSFGVWGLEKDEVKHYFQEFEKFSPDCKYPDCTHTQEPNCRVIEAVEEGLISALRYDSYLKLLANESWDME
jgi:ribosome biogenesis GTPase